MDKEEYLQQSQMLLRSMNTFPQSSHNEYLRLVGNMVYSSKI